MRKSVFERIVLTLIFYGNCIKALAREIGFTKKGMMTSYWHDIRLIAFGLILENFCIAVSGPNKGATGPTG